jgi:hypothetical protein
MAGSTLCQGVNVANSTTLFCTATSVVVGRFTVVVSLAGRNSSERVFLEFLCDTGLFGLPGNPCTSCPKVIHASALVGSLTFEVPQLSHVSTPECVAPQNAGCVRFFPVPLPLPGFFPTSLTEMAACVPSKACSGTDLDRVSAEFTELLRSERGNSEYTSSGSPHTSRGRLEAIMDVWFSEAGEGLTNDTLAHGASLVNLRHFTLELLNVSTQPCAKGLLCIALSYCNQVSSERRTRYFFIHQ